MQRKDSKEIQKCYKIEIKIHTWLSVRLRTKWF